MMRELLDFLVELSAHNNRDWFHEHKARYDVLRAGFVDDVQRLISLLAVADEELKGLQSQDCIYRIYRDIRFSPDKTPYKRFFSAYMARGNDLPTAVAAAKTYVTRAIEAGADVFAGHGHGALNHAFAPLPLAADIDM